VTQDPYYIWSKIAAAFLTRSLPKHGLHSSVITGENCIIDVSASVGAHCVIGDAVKLGANVVIAPGCVIGDRCEIGAGTHLLANVTVYHDVHIGERVIIASGTVIGSDGFGNARHGGRWHKIPQLGGVVIGNDVEIGANCAIDRGAIEDTVIGTGVRIDNLVQVAHNVRIGEHTAIAGCVGIAGSAEIGSHCMIGGQVGFAGHVKIADRVMIMGGTEVSKSIREPGVYASGIGGVVKNAIRRRNSAHVQRLEKLVQRIKILEEKEE